MLTKRVPSRRYVRRAAVPWREAAVQIVALAAFAGNGHRADAGIGSWGDAIAHVGDGGHEAWMIGKSPDIGFKYSHLALFGLNMWAWNGTYCVYQKYEKQYVAISSTKAAELLHKDEKDLRPPFEYRCPLGLFIFGPLLALGGVIWLREERAKWKAADSPTEPPRSSERN